MSDPSKATILEVGAKPPTNIDPSLTSRLLNEVERRMLLTCLRNKDESNTVALATRHHFGAGGSRLRARLAIDAGLRLGLSSEDAITLAVTCELLHNASLVQDDLLDDEPLRRNQPSVWVAFDRTAAICSGDLMLASAIASLAEISRVELLPRLLRQVQARAAEVILGQGDERAAECIATAEDQFHPAESSELTSVHPMLREYERVAIAKSASLLALPVELALIAARTLCSDDSAGAMYGDLSDKHFGTGEQSTLERARRMAECFAVAYQLIDDLEDTLQDRTNGSLNAVNRLTDAGFDYLDATVLVEQRAAELFELAQAQAQAMPENCAAVMVDYAKLAIKRLASKRELCQAH